MERFPKTTTGGARVSVGNVIGTHYVRIVHGVKLPRCLLSLWDVSADQLIGAPYAVNPVIYPVFPTKWLINLLAKFIVSLVMDRKVLVLLLYSSNDVLGTSSDLIPMLPIFVRCSVGRLSLVNMIQT